MSDTHERLFVIVKNADPEILQKDGIIHSRIIPTDGKTFRGILILASVPKDILPKIKNKQLDNIVHVDLRYLSLIE